MGLPGARGLTDATSSAVVQFFLAVFVLFLSVRIYVQETRIQKLEKGILMFKDAVTAELAEQTAAIQALASRLPTPSTVDPATIVSLEDQQFVIDGIGANTDAINAVAPTPAA